VTNAAIPRAQRPIPHRRSEPGRSVSTIVTIPEDRSDHARVVRDDILLVAEGDG
jgi:hypothetical protein